MCSKKLLESKISNKEKIVLSYNSSSFRRINIFVSFSYILAILSLIYFFQISKFTLLTSAILSFLYGAFFISIKNYVSASIKGEMLMTKNIYQKNKITDIKSIREISSITIFRINFTKVRYRLDGVNHSIQMIKYLNKDDIGNEVILRSVLKKAS